MRTGLLAVILLLPAFAAAKTGRDLQGDCSVAVKVFDKQTVSASADFIKVGDCTGFVSGVMQTAGLKPAGPGTVPSKDPAARFCAPPDVSVEQVVRMVLNRLKNKPEELDLDASAVVLRTLNEGFTPVTCIGGAGKQAEGLHWPEPPRKVEMRVRVVAVALAEPRSSFFSNQEILVADTEIADEEWSLIKLVFTYLPYQPRLEEAAFDYSVVHDVLAWRNTNCDETVAELTERSLPERHEPLIYSRNVPRVDLDRRRIPLPCYETKADDHIKSSLEPIPPPTPQPPARPVLQVRSNPNATPSNPVLPAHPVPTPTPSDRPVLKVRAAPQ